MDTPPAGVRIVVARIGVRRATDAGLATVRDYLRHASIATTSMYLHGDDVLRAREINQAFGWR